MFMVMNRLSCPPEYREHLERAFSHAGNLQGVPGFVLFHFLKNTAEMPEGGRLEYLALTQWESRAAYEAWVKSESFRAAHTDHGGAGPVTSALETYEALI